MGIQSGLERINCLGSCECTVDRYIDGLHREATRSCFGIFQIKLTSRIFYSICGPAECL